jgi:hypothetical protein
MGLRESGAPQSRGLKTPLTVERAAGHRQHGVDGGPWGEANPRLIVTSLGCQEADARRLCEKVYCARREHGERERGMLGQPVRPALDGDHSHQSTTAAVCFLRLRPTSLTLKHTQFAKANCATILLKQLKIGAARAGLGPRHQARHGLTLRGALRTRQWTVLVLATRRRQIQAAVAARPKHSSTRTL